jgi:hypothetical protein
MGNTLSAMPETVALYAVSIGGTTMEGDHRLDSHCADITAKRLKVALAS